MEIVLVYSRIQRWTDFSEDTSASEPTPDPASVVDSETGQIGINPDTEYLGAGVLDFDLEADDLAWKWPIMSRYRVRVRFRVDLKIREFAGVCTRLRPAGRPQLV